MLKAKQLACVSESGQKCPAARSLSLRRAWIEINYSVYGYAAFASLSLRRAWIEITDKFKNTMNFGRSPYGERGLKYQRIPQAHAAASRSPYGERGLKLDRSWSGLTLGESLSLRRAWIEINTISSSATPTLSRSPYGERGLKCHRLQGHAETVGRSPYGERGLKYAVRGTWLAPIRSLSLRRAWIEIGGRNEQG